MVRDTRKLILSFCLSNADSILAMKKSAGLGRFAPDAASAEKNTSSGSAAAAHIPIGSRCEVTPADSVLKKRGVVRFVGSTKFGKEGGVWIGVEYDEPIGKNDGS